MRYDVLLLDADRTLFDFDRSEEGSIYETFSRYGIPVSEETISLYRRINDRIWSQLERGEISMEQLGEERFRRFFQQIHREELDAGEVNRAYLTGIGARPYLLEGAEELCRTLSQSTRLYILTNGLTLAQTTRLERSAIRPYISDMYISQELGCKKPEQEYFEKVFQAIGLEDRSRAVMIGDSLTSDILGGIRAGIDTIWYNPEQKENDLEEKPTWTAGSFREICDIVLEI